MFTHIFALEDHLEVMEETHNESGASQEMETVQVIYPETESRQEVEADEPSLVKVSV
ncbi:hypothetical protein D3C76_1819950 [compost metagenome]